jgi:hypothetical protein
MKKAFKIGVGFTLGCYVVGIIAGFISAALIDVYQNIVEKL